MAVVYNKSHADFTTLAHQGDATVTVDGNLLTGTSGSIYTVAVNNSANSASSFLKFYDSKAPTGASDDPIMIIRAWSAGSRYLVMSSKQGVAFSTACSILTSTAGGTGASGSPTSDLEYTIFGS